MIRGSFDVELERREEDLLKSEKDITKLSERSEAEISISWYQSW
jgi:hypothetical protein